jgi:hypothetical protein
MTEQLSPWRWSFVQERLFPIEALQLSVDLRIFLPERVTELRYSLSDMSDGDTGFAHGKSHLSGTSYGRSLGTMTALVRDAYSLVGEGMGYWPPGTRQPRSK